MEIYFDEYDKHKAVRSVLTLGQFKKYVIKKEDSPGGKSFLCANIPGITVEEKTYPSFIFSVPIPENCAYVDIKENILLINLYETYLRKIAWDDEN